MFDISRSRVPGESKISIFFSTEYKEEIEVVWRPLDFFKDCVFKLLPVSFEVIVDLPAPLGPSIP